MKWNDDVEITVAILLVQQISLFLARIRDGFPKCDNLGFSVSMDLHLIGASQWDNLYFPYNRGDKDKKGLHFVVIFQWSFFIFLYKQRINVSFKGNFYQSNPWVCRKVFLIIG